MLCIVTGWIVLLIIHNQENAYNQVSYEILSNNIVQYKCFMDWKINTFLMVFYSGNSMLIVKFFIR